VPKFVIEREVPGAGNLSEAQLRELSQKSVKVLEEMGPAIQWLHSYVTGDKVYCVYLAPDDAAIREHARRVGIPANRVSAVRRLIDPQVRRERCTFPGIRISFATRVSRSGLLWANAIETQPRASAPLQ